MPSGGGFGFGPFRLDMRVKHLLRDEEPVVLLARHYDLLVELVSHAGEVVTKSRLMEVGWPQIVVTENNLVKAITHLRLVLDRDDPERYIATASRLGYRFVAPVVHLDDGVTDADLDALLAPHRAWMDGRAALETLERAELARARSTFEGLLVRHPREASFHVGLANACVLQFEATRADPAPDTDALQRAVAHARSACRLNVDSAEAWATLGFILERTGARADALAALRRSVTLEPDNWRHHLRLSYGSWAEERLRAARRTLAELPDCPMAHCLTATVYVARDALAQAEREIDAGLATLPGESRAPARFSAVALHWLKGLLCLARGADDEALDAFERELALESRGHLYARECCANTWYAIGACQMQRGDAPAARAAFEQAIARVPSHPMAHAGLAVIEPSRERHAPLVAAPMPVDLALARAACLVAEGDASGAAQLVATALAAAPPGNAGWLVPIEPLLDVQRTRAVWAPVRAALRTRAS